MSKLVDSLLKLGFTVDDLLNKGILVEANQEEQEDQQEQQEQQEEQVQEQEEQQEQAQEQEQEQEQYITRADLDSFKQELLQVVQSVNRSGAVRDSQPEKKMTMAEAIIGLTKEVK